MAVAMIGPKFYAWDRNGKPLAFGKLYTYEARTNTPKPTYQSEDQVVENSNPVILNGEGYANVYLSGSYKMVLKDKDENEIWSSDPVSSNMAEEWMNCATATYLSPTSFKLVGNFTDSYTKGRKVRLDSNAVEFDYSTIESSSYAAGETTVIVVDSVVKTGLVQTCASVVSPTSSFNSEDLIKLTDYVFSNVDDMVSGVTSGNITINHKLGNQYSTGGTVWRVESSGLVQLDTGLFAEPITAINVKDFGATGDGATDDTDALQAALDLISTTSGGISYRSGKKLVFPKNTYIISKPLIFKGDNLNVDGQNSTIIKITDDLPSRSLSDISVPGGSVSPMQNAVFTCENAIRFSRFENFNLEGLDGTSQPTAIWMVGNENIFRNIFIRNCLDGMHIPSMWMNVVEHVVVRGGRHGFWWDRSRIGGGTGQTGTSTHFLNCASFGADGKGYYIQDLDYSRWSACAADVSTEEAYWFQGCSGLNAQIAFESRDGDVAPAIRFASGTYGNVTMDCYEDVAKTQPVILATESKVQLSGRMRHTDTVWIDANVRSEIDARGLSIDPLSGSELDPNNFVIQDADSTIYYTTKEPKSGMLYQYQFTSQGERITPQGVYMDSLATNSVPAFVYGHSKLRVVYDVTDFNTTYNDKIVVPLSEIEKVIPNFSNSSWAKTPLELRIVERGNFGVGDWVLIESGAISGTGQRAYVTHGSASKVAVQSMAIVGDNLEITMDPAGGSRQRVSCEIVPL